MSKCEKGIDCLQCSGRAMCSSYANFKYEQGYKEAIDNVKNLITERLQKNCNKASCDDCEECCEVSALLWIEKQLN